MTSPRSGRRTRRRHWGLLGELRLFVFDTSLTLLFVGLFVVSIIGQSVSGYYYYDQQLASHGLLRVGFGQWLATGTFLNAALVNWQAAVLQLTVLILAGAYLHQRGASHSRKPEEDQHANAEATNPRNDRAWLRRNSLFVGFLVLFLLFFVAHIFTGHAAANETRALTQMSPVSVTTYVVSAEFWFENFQTWEAEFVTIAIFLILTIFLREQGSPESKRVTAGDADTGDTYE